MKGKIKNEGFFFHFFDRKKKNEISFRLKIPNYTYEI